MREVLPLFLAGLAAAGMFAAVVLGVWAVEVEHRGLVTQLAARLQRPPRIRISSSWAGGDHALDRALRPHLARAGSSRSPGELFAAIVLFAAAGALLVGVVVTPLLGVLGLGAGILPVLWIRRAGRLRGERIAAQLPEAFELIGRSLRAGRAFPDALQASGREIAAPLGEELALVAERHRLGLDMRSSLEELRQRQPDNVDIQLFVSMVLLHQESGGNLVETLQQLSDTIRERAVAREKLGALTAEVRMSAMIVGVLPFFVTGVLLWVRPAYLLPLVQTSLGHVFSGVALGSLGIGFLAMRAVAQVED